MAHIGGAIFGYIYIKQIENKKNSIINDLMSIFKKSKQKRDNKKNNDVDLVLEKIYSGASSQGSSRILPSEDVWRRFASVLKGGSPILSLGTVIWFFSA